MSADCASDLVFDRYSAEELSAAEVHALQAHLEHCVRCSLRFDVILTQRQAFLTRAPSLEQLPRRMQARMRKSPLWAAGAALALAAAGMLALLPPAAQETARSKGKPQLGVFVKHAQQVTRAQSGDAVRPGDQLRFVYTSAQAFELAVLQRDAHSAAIYYPLGTQTAHVAAGRNVALDFSITLDDAPGDETLFGLFCERPVQLAPLLAALQAGGQLIAPSDCQVDVFTLHKRLGPP